nr:glycoside hydrolase family 2 TIM barrel-domain containing protein [Spirochaetota bacterium]
MSEPFILGVNYWPRRKAMSWWSDFDKGEVDDEFALIKSYGMTLVRIFLLWDDFQKSPDSISSKALSDLETVFEIAEKHSLKLDVTFFTGHMSGPNWAPGWSLEGSPLAGARKLVCGGQIVNSSYLNPFHNPLMISAEKKLITEVVSIFKDHSALYMWNLGNEPDLFSINNNESATDWVKIMTEFIHSIDVRHPVTCGLHSASLSEVNSFRVDEVFAHTDIAVMHAYPM